MASWVSAGAAPPVGAALFRERDSSDHTLTNNTRTPCLSALPFAAIAAAFAAAFLVFHNAGGFIHRLGCARLAIVTHSGVVARPSRTQMDPRAFSCAHECALHQHRICTCAFVGIPAKRRTLAVRDKIAFLVHLGASTNDALLPPLPSVVYWLVLSPHLVPALPVANETLVQMDPTSPPRWAGNVSI